MTELPQALENLEKARKDSDLEAIVAACQDILNTDLEAEIKHQARYELGLCHLWRKENFEEAISLFAEVAKKPKKDDLSSAARASLAICLWHHGQGSKAIFELRKMIPKGCAPTMHTATALDFLHLFLIDAQADPQSVKQTQALRLTHLGFLHKESKVPAEKSAWALRLAVCLSEVGDGPSRARAKVLCQEIIALRADLADDLIDNAQNILKTL